MMIVIKFILYYLIIGAIYGSIMGSFAFYFDEDGTTIGDLMTHIFSRLCFWPLAMLVDIFDFLVYMRSFFSKVLELRLKNKLLKVCYFILLYLF